MKKFYITTSIAYTNAPPHLGFAHELIQADVLARYHRTLGHITFFLTGTDEHGQKNLKAAQEEGKTPKEFVDEISKKFKALKKFLNLSNDDFIRTTDRKRHWPAVAKVWLKLKENGDIYKKKYKGFYCFGCEAFIKKKDLVKGKCPIHKSRPQIIEEENYFFRLSKYQKEIKKNIEREKLKIIPSNRKKEILNFIKQGLEDLSCSRLRKVLKWGIPVPDDKNQTIYIWLEALVNYISALGYAKNENKFKKFWPADVHCIGKDIFKFHCILWPAILLSLNLPLPKKIFIHGFITVNGQKMSKSLGNIIDPFELVKKYGTDAVRYFLLREIPPTEDGDFTYEKFEKRYNSDLAKGLGNLLARVVRLVKTSNFRFSIPKQIPNSKFKTIIKRTWKDYHKTLNEFKFNESLIGIWELIGFCDKYIEREKPWELMKDQKSETKSQRLKIILKNLLFTLNNLAKMLQPFLPETSERIFQQIKNKKSQPLFPKI